MAGEEKGASEMTQTTRVLWDAVEWMRKAREEIQEGMDEASIERALKDYHARRKPRHCGMTVHSGIGCDNECVYCYVPEMSFTAGGPRPYPLSPREFALALASNPWILPTRWGTFLAFGSVADPFHPQLAEKTVDYMRVAKAVLGNPIQFSTKMPPAQQHMSFFQNLPREGVSPLITVVTTKRHRALEPKAPPPSQRLEFAEKLAKMGYRVALFLRPIIPGVTDREVSDILDEAKSHGIGVVVAGSLRITENIMERMKASGIAINEVLKRTKRVSKRQIPIYSRDLKKMVARECEKRNLVYLDSACCATALATGVPCIELCWLVGRCTGCPNKCYEKVPELSSNEARELLAAIGCEEVSEVEVATDTVRARTANPSPQLAYLAKTLFRRNVVFEK